MVWTYPKKRLERWPGPGVRESWPGARCGGPLSGPVSNLGLVLSVLVRSLTILVSSTVESQSPPGGPEGYMSQTLALIGRTSGWEWCLINCIL
jgi:hypothetical protein